jgi:hypothetical protein
VAKKSVTLSRGVNVPKHISEHVLGKVHEDDEDELDLKKQDVIKEDAYLEDKKYVAAAEAMPVGTVVWYWNGSNPDPLAAIIAARADAEHCHLMVITPMGQAQDRQNVKQGKKGDKAAGEYFLAMGSVALA